MCCPAYIRSRTERSGSFGAYASTTSDRQQAPRRLLLWVNYPLKRKLESPAALPSAADRKSLSPDLLLSAKIGHQAYRSYEQKRRTPSAVSLFEMYFGRWCRWASSGLFFNSGLFECPRSVLRVKNWVPGRYSYLDTVRCLTTPGLIV